MTTPIATMHNTVRVKTYTRRVAEGIIPGAEVRVSKANVFIPFEQLRAIADSLHDICDMYEEQAQNGTLGASFEEVAA